MLQPDNLSPADWGSLTPEEGGSILKQMQMSSRKRASKQSLLDLRRGEEAVISGVNLPEDIQRRLMELGFLPGHRVRAGRTAPGGDPRVFEVDGSEIAMRAETAVHIAVERPAAK